MRAKSIVLVVALLGTACKGGASETPSEPSATCYAGTATYGATEADLAAASSCDPSTEGCDGPLPLLLRRTLRPADSTIVEDWVEGQSKSTFASKGSAVSKVDEAKFEYEVVLEVNPRGQGAERKQSTWKGSGELEGEPWMWTSWTAKQEREPPGVDVVTARIDGDTLVRSIDYSMLDGSAAFRRRDSLEAFSCAEWDARVEATLSADGVRREVAEDAAEAPEDAAEAPAP